MKYISLPITLKDLLPTNSYMMVKYEGELLEYQAYNEYLQRKQELSIWNKFKFWLYQKFN